jgi:AAA domain, putative AbiEii toxin, Type IV TA system/AAA ATPase domain
MAKRGKNGNHAVAGPMAITEINVAGFKSISEEQCIEIRPLTILAGANSSGKSSVMQPLLLLKQTLEAPYDAGPLLLNGPNLKFTSADQLLSRIRKQHSSGSFQAGIGMNSGESFQAVFGKEHKMGFRIEQMNIADSVGTYALWPGMTQTEIIDAGIRGANPPDADKSGQWEIVRQRCFLWPAWVVQVSGGFSTMTIERTEPTWERIIPQIIHLPGLRGNPERSYPVAAVGPTYPGTFDKYTASIISQWMEENKERVEELNSDLKFLKLTGGVFAKQMNGVQIEVWVGRLPDVPPTRPEDRVNIADVGVGVSQTLPILVALRVALPGQLVYIEQPETHLHPNAQFALAQVLANAANRGVRVVVETHSSILLLGVQTLVAQGSLGPDKVKLHWFARQKDGKTMVQGGELDEAGRFGEWPEDFDNILLRAQKSYLDAAEKRLFAQ